MKKKRISPYLTLHDAAAGAISEDAGHSLGSAEVAAFLKAQPQFFVEHPEVLADIALPHSPAGAVSLIERQVAVLREANIDLRRELQSLKTTALTNQALFSKFRNLSLTLFGVASWPHLNEALATHLLVDFDADFVCCHVQPSTLQFDHLRGHAEQLPSEAFLTQSRPHCTSLRQSELAAIFPVQEHEGDGSAVIAPLPLREGAGVIAIGSRDPLHYASDMDTLFIDFTAEVLARTIDRLNQQHRT